MNDDKSKPKPTALALHKKLTFTGGKYKGVPVCEVPSDYLLFIRYQNRKFIEEFDHVLRERGDMPLPTLPRIEELVIAGQQTLSMKYDPVCGVFEQEMLEVKAAADVLFELIKKLK